MAAGLRGSHSNGQTSGRAKRRKEDATEPEDVEIVTWNILSSALCTDDYYRHNDPQDLDSSVRLKRVLTHLQEVVQRGAIICLQECSMDWCGELHTFFQQRGYHFVTSLYGGVFSGYMGIGIAVPTKLFKLCGVRIQRVSEAKSWPPEPRPESKIKKGLLRRLLDVAGYFASPRLLSKEEVENDSKEEVQDAWSYSRNRQNTMICIRLRSRDSSEIFTVVTYHMPCVFWNVKVMVIHAALCCQAALRFASGTPLILAGDFNFKPGSAPYQLLTTGKLSETHPAHPGMLEGDAWSPELKQSLRSAFAEKHRAGEPEFTNYAWQGDDLDPFIGTLDYIFVTKDAEVVQVGQLPRISECRDPLPTTKYPSDHLLLNARVRPFGRPKKEAASTTRSGLSRPEDDQAKSAEGVGTRERGFGTIAGRLSRRPVPSQSEDGGPS